MNQYLIESEEDALVRAIPIQGRLSRQARRAQITSEKDMLKEKLRAQRAQEVADELARQTALKIERVQKALAEKLEAEQEALFYSANEEYGSF